VIWSHLVHFSSCETKPISGFLTIEKTQVRKPEMGLFHNSKNAPGETNPPTPENDV
jgi:hypothetical protein